MADQRRSNFYAVFTMSLWIKTIVSKFAISNHTAVILRVHALRSYLKLICEYELHSLPNKTLVAQRIMVQTASRSDRPRSAIFCVIVYCFFYLTNLSQYLSVSGKKDQAVQTFNSSPCFVPEQTFHDPFFCKTVIKILLECHLFLF